MAKLRPFNWVYAALWLVRIWFALYGRGYIHPDEHMQNGEVTAGTLAFDPVSALIDTREQGKILGFHALTTWEWLPDFPVRSVLPIFVTTGLPLFILRLLCRLEWLTLKAHPSLVFGVQRFAFLCLSSVLDYSVLSLVSLPASRRLCLLLLASSYVTCTFQIRPFSNALESILVSLCLVLLRRIVDKRTHLTVREKSTDDRSSRAFHDFKFDLHLFAVLAIVGVFTRPTFLSFAFPIGYQILQLSCQVTGSPVRAIGLLLPPFCTATLAASALIVIDTYYFRSDFSKLVVTPYNFVKYNLSTKNLTDHGLHPNWLHVGVNLPMLLGPLLIWLTWCNIYKYVKPSPHRHQKVHFETDILRQTLIQIIVLSLSVLSVQPHQEARFLMPLVPVIIILAATAKLPRPGNLFWTAWIIFNTMLALVFGVLHQGGVVPSLVYLHSTLKDATAGSSTHIVYWKTYIPPRHLLGVSQQEVASGKLSLTDLSGSPRNELMATLSASSFTSTYLVAPVPVYLMLPESITSCIALKKRIFPHLDLDHIPESIHAGVFDGLSLGIYVVERNCITGWGNAGTFVT